MKLEQKRAWTNQAGETKITDQVILTGGMSWDFEEDRDYKVFSRQDGTSGRVVNLNLVVEVGNNQVEYWRVSGFDRIADRLMKMKDYLRKGLKLLVVGEPKQDTYTAKDGTQKTQNSVNVFTFDVIGWPKREDGSQGGQNTEKVDDLPSSFEPIDDFNDEIPF